MYQDRLYVMEFVTKYMNSFCVEVHEVTLLKCTNSFSVGSA
jgi:hypothetical protein